MTSKKKYLRIAASHGRATALKNRQEALPTPHTPVEVENASARIPSPIVLGSDSELDTVWQGGVNQWSMTDDEYDSEGGYETVSELDEEDVARLRKSMGLYDKIQAPKTAQTIQFHKVQIPSTRF
ncbi:hypothetical protein C0992_004642 [Termitomyces sp. T32_za158]|nr:hypothetical protein C0992_004642 [Termitomyces sp. T32_za158]